MHHRYHHHHHCQWLLLLLPLLLLSSPMASYEIPSPPPSDALALLSFKSHADPHNNILPFNTTTSNATTTAFPHCHWPGIHCSTSGRVLRIVLESLALPGRLPSALLDPLDQLRVLSLKNNTLHGPIPDLSPLSNLKALFLSYNLFQGPIPPQLATLRRLRTLDLSHNALQGPVPSAFTQCPVLAVLRLEANRLDGPVPPFNQSALKNFNVSFNRLSGAVPVTALLVSIGPSAFKGNALLCGVIVGRVCSSHFQFFGNWNGSNGSNGGHGIGNGNKGGGNGTGNVGVPAEQSAGIVIGERQGVVVSGEARRMRRRAVLGIGILAGGVGVIGVLGICVVVRRRRRRGIGKGGSVGTEKEVAVGDGGDSGIETYVEEIENGGNELAAAAALAMTEEKVKRMGRSGSLVFCAGEAPVYSLEQLMRGSAEMLGRGSIGTTYKAVLGSGVIVSVKRLDGSKVGAAGKEGFEGHMDTVGRLRHPNLVPLRAFFQAKEERLLVYDYQPNGSLYSLIHGIEFNDATCE